MRRLVEILDAILKNVLIVLMAAMVIAVSWQVISRYVFSSPSSWTEEIARFCFIWIILIGSMIAVRDGSHFTVDLLPPAKTKRGEAIGHLFVDLIMALVGVIFIMMGLLAEIQSRVYFETQGKLPFTVRATRNVFKVADAA